METLKDILIKFQEWQLENGILNANFAHSGVAQKFIDKREAELRKPLVISSVCTCEKPDPYAMMPYKCFRCSGKIPNVQTDL